MVDRFYGEVRKHPRLGPIFEDRVSGNWEPHLARMKQFWRSVLLKTGEYHGRPVPMHVAMVQIESEDFKLWLDIFRRTARDCFEPGPAAALIRSAERIAQSLWLAKFASPHDTVPGWLVSTDQTDASS